MQAALLDTDILSELLKQKNATVVRRAADYLNDHGQFAISSITRYEVLRGLKEKNASAQLQQFATFCQHSLVIPVTENVIDLTSDLWVFARRNGHPHRDADLLIAASALEHNRTLATGNTHDFQWIPNLVLENWRVP